MSGPGTLYLIPTTLGPVDPARREPLSHAIPPEVCALTAGLRYVIAENAKSARAFLKLVAATHPLAVPLQEIRIAELNVNTAPSALPELLAPLEAGQDAGLISEAGAPAVADPGADLVRLAHRRAITVRPLVGPSSLLLALMGSGLNGQSFAFNGYLPLEADQRAQRIRELEQRSQRERQTQIFIETPYRNDALLETLAGVCRPTTLITTATDLTLASEAIRTRSAHEWKQAIAAGKAASLHKKPTVFLFLAGG